MKTTGRKRLRSAGAHSSKNSKRPTFIIKKVNDSNQKDKSAANSLEKLNELKKNPEDLSKLSQLLSESNFDQLKYNNIVYKIGDVLSILSADQVLIGELLKIIPSGGIKEYPFWPSIQVRWYYKKSEINRAKNNLLNEQNYESISEYEVFTSEHKDIVYIETILSKCKVCGFDEYESLQEPNEYTYFTRAKYDHINEVLIPRFNDWKKTCMCQKPMNPDLIYIECAGCKDWCHLKCAGITVEESKNIDYYCVKCSKKKMEQKLGK